MFYYDWTMILVIPGLLLGMWAQFKVKSAFEKYEKVRARTDMSAQHIARRLLDRNGCENVTIESTAGHLTDHYDPRSNVLRLSSSVHGAASVAAIGVAAHECGHAMQQKEGYGPLKLRSTLVPVVNFGSNLYFPLFLLGLVMSWDPLVNAGIICFGLTLLFALVTLPVEFNASSRAIRALGEGGYLDRDELAGAKAVLDAAALTYVASAISSLLHLVRLLIIARRNDRD